jgi:hypothetical protein
MDILCLPNTNFYQVTAPDTFLIHSKQYIPAPLEAILYLQKQLTLAGVAELILRPDKHLLTSLKFSTCNTGKKISFIFFCFSLEENASAFDCNASPAGLFQ